MKNHHGIFIRRLAFPDSGGDGNITFPPFPVIVVDQKIETKGTSPDVTVQPDRHKRNPHRIPGYLLRFITPGLQLNLRRRL